MYILQILVLELAARESCDTSLLPIVSLSTVQNGTLITDHTSPMY